MRKFFATAAACLGFLAPASAADLGGPKPPGTVVEESGKPQFQGLYLEGSATAAAFEINGLGTESFGFVGIGAGYDHRVAHNIAIGVFARYDFGRDADTRMLHLGARAGYLVNPHLMIYAPLMYSVDGTNFDLTDGIWSAGLGLETYIASNFAIFAEGMRNFAAQGAAGVFDEATAFRAGVKFRF